MSSPTNHVSRWSDCAPEAMKHVQARADRRSESANIVTGFRDLDLVLGPLEPGRIIAVSSDPTIGRTTFVLDLCRSVAFRQKKTCLLFSPRTSRLDLSMRILSAESKVAYSTLACGAVNADELLGLTWASAETGGSDLLIVDKVDRVDEVCEAARAAWLEHGVDFLVVDDADALTSLGSSGVGVPRALLFLAQDLNIPVVLAAQNPTDRSCPEPPGEGRCWPQSFPGLLNTTIEITRPDVDWPDSDRPNEADLHIQTSQADLGFVTLAWQGHYSRMNDMPA